MIDLNEKTRSAWLVKKISDEWKKGLLKSVGKGAGRFFAAAIVDVRGDGKLITTGVNSVIKNKNPFDHAEVVAMKKGLKKLDILTYESYHVLVSSHEPCPMCIGAAYWSGINRIFYLYTYEETEKQFGVSGDIKLTRALAGRAHFRTSELLRLIPIDNKRLKKNLNTIYDGFTGYNKNLKDKTKIV